MIESNFMKKLSQYFSANLDKFYFLLIVSLFLTLIYPWHWNGLYGFDWTDTTYHFQQALNVYRGAVIGADFANNIENQQTKQQQFGGKSFSFGLPSFNIGGT